jgi:hypothetical protein
MTAAAAGAAIGRDQALHDEGHQKRALVRRCDDRQIEAACYQGRHHGQRQQPQQRQLIHERLQSADRGKVRNEQGKAGNQQYKQNDKPRMCAGNARLHARHQVGKTVVEVIEKRRLSHWMVLPR